MKRESIQIYSFGCLGTMVFLGIMGYIYKPPTEIIYMLSLSILFVFFIILCIVLLSDSLIVRKDFDEMSRVELERELDRRKAKPDFCRSTRQGETGEIKERINEKLDE